jgi:hypothetical protein
VSSLGEFYSDNLSKETNKGKLERSLQGFHNGAVPWGYISTLQGNRKVGVPDPEKVPVVLEMFERYATGLQSDFQIARWLNDQGFTTIKHRQFGKDAVRDLIRNPYYIGQICYRGMSVQQKGITYKSTPPKVSEGQHKPIISQELWEQCQVARERLRVTVKTEQRVSRVHLLQSLAVCAYCGRRLRVQTPKGRPTYYREDSHLRGFYDCIYSGKSIHADDLDTQIASIVKSIKLTSTWEQDVRQLLHEDDKGPDLEIERREIREKLRFAGEL